MATIGTFQKTDDGFKGVISTLTLQSWVTIHALDKTHANAPDYAVRIGTAPAGFGWVDRAAPGDETVRITLDDPAFARPITGTLVPADGAYRLTWSR